MTERISISEIFVIHDIKVFNKPNSIWTSLAAFLALSAGLSIFSIELFAFVDRERWVFWLQLGGQFHGTIM